MSKRPNILWIFGDQHRGQSVGCAGDPNVFTPNLDRMSIEGMHFPQAISNNPWCCPFRFTMMTGLWPHQGVYKTPMGMDPATPTVATHLNGAGYRTHYIGKWHLSHTGTTAGEHSVITDPETRGGFHSWIGYENNNSQYDCWVHGHDEAGAEIDPYRLSEYETAGLTDLAVTKIRSKPCGNARVTTIRRSSYHCLCNRHMAHAWHHQKT